MIRHDRALSRPSLAVALAMIRATLGGPLVAAPRRPTRGRPRHLAARLATVPMPAITAVAEVEQRSTTRTDDQPQRLHAASPSRGQSRWTRASRRATTTSTEATPRGIRGARRAQAPGSHPLAHGGPDACTTRPALRHDFWRLRRKRMVIFAPAGAPLRGPASALRAATAGYAAARAGSRSPVPRTPGNRRRSIPAVPRAHLHPVRAARAQHRLTATSRTLPNQRLAGREAPLRLGDDLRPIFEIWPPYFKRTCPPTLPRPAAVPRKCPNFSPCAV